MAFLSLSSLYKVFFSKNLSFPVHENCMKKVLILGANSYIGNSFQKYIGENYNDQYEVHKVSLRGEAWKEDDWSGYDSILNVTGKAHADIGILTEEQKQEYYAVNKSEAKRS